MKVSLKILFTFFVVISASQALTPEQLRLIDEVVADQFIPRNNVTGLSLSIVENGETVLSKGYGKQDIENGIDANNNTLFSIGSITKSFVATLVVKTLSEQYPQYGEGALDLPIAFFDSGFNFTFSDRFRAEQTSFRDLLSHRTCLVSQDFELLFGSIPTDREFNYRTRYEVQGCGHREQSLYNNALYALAGDMIAAFNGKSIEQLIREFMLELGMNNSTTIDLSASYEGLPQMSQCYYQKDGEIHKFNQTLLRRVAIALGAGGILSSSTDMAKYMEFHINKGRVGDKQVVSEEALSWLYKSSIQIGVLPGKISDTDGPTGRYGYGLGFFLGAYDGYATIDHGGYWPPYHSTLFLYQNGEKQLGVFLTSNGPGRIVGPMTYEIASSAIFDIVRTGAYKANLERNMKKPNLFGIHGDMAHPIGRLVKDPTFKASDFIETQRVEFGEVVGLYGHETGGDLRIKLDTEDTRFLEVNWGEWGIGRLHPVSGSDTKYLIEWKTDFAHHFYTYPPEVWPVPIMHIDFRPMIKSLYILSDDEVNAVFVRDATIGTFPVIPWDPASCGPYLG
jgi:CubicO group peptidase (beta-lactamase class C family)